MGRRAKPTRSMNRTCATSVFSGRFVSVDMTRLSHLRTGLSIVLPASHCVINLSADKDRVLREAFRVLKPGGRFAVSDVVVDGELPAAVRADMEAYVGCVAGALEKSDYLARLSAAGFIDASIEPTRRYRFSDLEGTSCCSPVTKALPAEEKAAFDGRI